MMIEMGDVIFYFSSIRAFLHYFSQYRYKPFSLYADGG